MSGPDLLLLHPPSIWDFRTRPRLAGPVSDLVPSTPVFEMYPFGYVTIADYLDRNGLEVRIVNLAVLMQKDPRFDPEKFIKRQDPGAFGIGLHWLPHAHGALEVAKLCKKHHPDTPVLMGGLSATYYHEEIIRDYHFIDHVMRGDSTERPLVELLNALKKGGDLSEVPNLTWRGGNGSVKVNTKFDSPDNLDHLSFDYDIMIKSIARYRDIMGHMPTLDWRRYPVTALMFVRGCTQNCITCGGSCFSFEKVYGREKPVYRNPADVIEDILSISTIHKGPIVIVGDIRLPGRSYHQRIIDGLRRERFDNQLVFELFWPMSKRIMKEIERSVDNYNLSFSPESHDHKVREAQGRRFSNESIERCIRESFESGCKRFDLYFMLGLPKQGPESGLKTVEFCSKVMADNKGRALHCYISPLAPFLDPGSKAFEDPKAHGYILKAKGLEEHRQRLTLPSWKLALNYETKWMTADDIMKSTYESAAAMNDAKLEFGVIGKEIHGRIRKAIEVSVVSMAKIDEIMKLPDKERRSRLSALKKDLDRTERDILCGDGEMEWPAKGIKYGGVFWKLFKRRKKRK
jgi:B12-binding domain/radical SAM domain protein